jgi:hypothetical protein
LPNGPLGWTDFALLLGLAHRLVRSHPGLHNFTSNSHDAAKSALLRCHMLTIGSLGRFRVEEPAAFAMEEQQEAFWEEEA